MAIVVLGVLVFTGSAQACSCAPVPRAEAMERADAAISGRLVAVVPQGPARAVYSYRVRRVYKRAAGLRRGLIVSVRSTRSAAACGLPKRRGRRYELLLERRPGGWSSGLCGLLRRQRCAA